MAYNPERYNNDPEYRERRKQLSKAYYDRVKDTPEFKAKNLARVNAWREANPEKRRAYTKSEKHREYSRRYYSTHKKEPTLEQIQLRRIKAKERYYFERKILTDPVFAAHVCERTRNRVFAAAEKRKEYCHKQYAEHREEMLARNKQYREAHPDRCRQLARESYRRRAAANKQQINKEQR